jgi:hypothetical protein
VHVAGVSHFDVYARLPQPARREPFFAEQGLDPARRLITFGTISPWLFPFNAEIAEILARAVAEDAFDFPCQLVVRLHPQVLSSGTPHTENLQGFQKLAARFKHVRLDVPPIKSTKLMWDVGESDMLHLAELLRYSDVTVNAGSTLSIDGAIVDTPIVNVGFDGFHSVAYEKSVIRLYDFTHYAKLVKTGAVRIARDRNEMIALINTYLAQPELDREARARLVREQCFRIDGQSGERVGRLLLAMLQNSTADVRGFDAAQERAANISGSR